MVRSCLAVAALLVCLPLAAAPSVLSFTPVSGPASGGTTVTITGSNFEPGSTVRFGAVAATSSTFISSTSLTAVAPPQEPGMVAIVVTNPDGASANKTGFTYTPVPRVVITNVLPASGSAAGGETITINGTGFLQGATATLGGNPLFNLSVAYNQIVATTPSGPVNFASNAIVDLTVKNPDGTSASLGKAYTYVRPAVAITGISPRNGSPSGGTAVTITGRGFTTALPVSIAFNGTAATDVKVINTTTIVATAPAGAAGAVDVGVTVGDASAVAQNAFRYQVAPPRRRAQ